MNRGSPIEPKDDDNAQSWIDRADETNRYLGHFDKYIWPIYERHGYTDKTLALIAFNLGPADADDDDEDNAF